MAIEIELMSYLVYAYYGSRVVILGIPGWRGLIHKLAQPIVHQIQGPSHISAFPPHEAATHTLQTLLSRSLRTPNVMIILALPSPLPVILKATASGRALSGLSPSDLAPKKATSSILARIQ